jgi:hypothetical protein
VDIYQSKYHLTESLYRDSHKEKSQYTDDEMRTDFTEFSQYSPPEHDYESCEDARESDTDETIAHTIGMHRYDICHTRSGEGERKGEGYDESFIEVFMEDVISFDRIDLRGVYLFPAYHRKSDEKQYHRSSDTEILCLQSEKCEHILPDEKCEHHPNEYDQSETSTIFFILFTCRIWVELRVKRKRRKWLEEGYECHEHDADESRVE